MIYSGRQEVIDDRARLRRLLVLPLLVRGREKSCYSNHRGDEDRKSNALDENQLWATMAQDACMGGGLRSIAVEEQRKERQLKSLLDGAWDFLTCVQMCMYTGKPSVPRR